ncbi:thiamine phosphate synthase [Paracoccus contaminans]|uniref:Thiamine-phosphate synthase n=1 Tax=Paracoccus contaminans TaxID=1945662 RepID=A0A1W6CZ57_9RHOB|nr:thiamine phosphate synthase [Paracoccus contaminans]ARJ70150.1 thiamine-phosphate diphosphorylase [Paracoccus contaminans]
MSLPRFYPVFDSAGWVARALAAGVRMVQLRIKDADEATLRAEITRARDMARAAGAILVVNDHWQLAIDLGCDWLHLGQEDLDGADLPAIRAAGLRLGVSTHDDAELERALSVRPDYVALGPVWPTILKQMPWAPQGLERVTEWKRRIGDVPLCAIGGLTPERGCAALAAGADLVAAVTDITLNPDPEDRMRAWLAAVGEAGPGRCPGPRDI